MFKKFALLLCACCGAFFAQAAPDAAAIHQLLVQADALRQPVAEGVLTFAAQVFRDGKESAQTTYTVQAKGANLSLIHSADGANKGLRVLMNADNLWVRLPGSSRALRITPMQKLMGDVSYGDLGKLRWAEDYEPVAGETQEEALDGTPALRLKLAARNANASYPAIVLWLAQEGGRPLQAHFHLGSGKLLKSARFAAPVQMHGKSVIREITYTDALNSQAHSILRLLEFQEQTFAASHFSIAKFRE